MKSLAKAARVNQVIEVIQHMNSGMTTVDACQEVGLSRSSFYDIIKNNPEAIAEYQEMVQPNAQNQPLDVTTDKANPCHAHQVGLILFVIWFFS